MVVCALGLVCPVAGHCVAKMHLSKLPRGIAMKGEETQSDIWSTPEDPVEDLFLPLRTSLGDLTRVSLKA